MKRFLVFAGALLLGLSVAACAGASSSNDYPSGIWRYKITIEVETPEGLKTGSSVREISAMSRPEMLAEGNDTHITLSKGEAVVVDLGKRGLLFAILQGINGNPDQPYWAVFDAFPSPCREGPVSRCGIRYYSTVGVIPPSELQLTSYPMLVMFDNLQDPLTVRRLIDVKKCTAGEMPNAKNLCIDSDHFAQLFGEGVRLKSIKIELTDNKPEFHLEKYLTWLSKAYGSQLDGSKFQFLNSQHPLANALSVGAFSTEVGKK